jgi:hypothetical protein
MNVVDYENAGFDDMNANERANRAEIDRLRLEVKALKEERAGLHITILDLGKQARRYFWLRDQPEAQELLDNSGQWFVSQNHDTITPDGRLLDAAIDAARAALAKVNA